MAAFSEEELNKLISMLEALVEDRTLLAEVSTERRIALLQAAGRISRPTRFEQQRSTKAFRFITKKQKKDADKVIRAATEIRSARRAEVFTPPKQLISGSPNPAENAPDNTIGELSQSRDCYVCKVAFRKVHPFYDAMCTPCAELNYAKRFQTASLVGRVALITGARIKIGYQAALMMLRAGAHVIVTTRFPRDAASRYAREPDFADWKRRLEVYGLDLRHVPSVEIFARYLTQTKPRLDILINNAAQTVRRPPAFYTHMVDLEMKPYEDLPLDVQSILKGHENIKSALSLEAPRAHLLNDTNGASNHGGSAIAQAEGFVAWSGDGPGTGIRSSALLSQVPCDFDDPSNDREMFPAGKTDLDLQQVDLRVMNSWRMTLSQVPSPEMLEVQLVNAVAPFILCSKLKELMLRHPTGEKHIVNVSAMEGQFARRTKTDKHPHTNMAKAALNMMTLTSAPDYAASGIFMNAVDTGWVTDEDPILLSNRKQAEHDFQPPLDIVDGAARICDPFFSGLITGKHVWGKFLKDYGVCEW
jgi:NAD(P)-dependent dehydrogenase (short-subunit alcohol dehydrogenase family)